MNARFEPSTMRLPRHAPLILAAILAAGGCNMADDTGKNDRKEAERTVEPVPAPAVKSERQPARARLDELDTAPPPAAAPKAGEVTRGWFAGSWTDSGDCADAGHFATNGTYLLADGTRGMWNIQDGRLVVQHAAGRSALQLRRVDKDTVELVNEDGSVGRSTRCG
jgi:hypothetical protein